MASIPARSQYSADGGAAWALLPMAAVAALVAAAAVGWLFQLASSLGFYLFIVFPIFGGLALAGVLHAMVRWTRCRNRLAAAALGLIVGVATYVCYYEFGMLRAIPANVGWRFDLLPQYILHRLKTDVVRSTHEIGNPQQQRHTPNFPLNCILLGIDFAILLGVTTVSASRRAGYAYCPELGEWMRRESATWPPQSSRNFLAALAEGKLLEFVAKTPAAGNPRACCRLTVEYAAPAAGSTLSYPIYGTLADASQTLAWHRPKWSPATLLRQIVLSPAETLALRPLLPKLAKLLSAQHPELAALPAEVMPAAGAPPAGSLAQISGVPVPPGRRIRTPAAAVWVNFLHVAPVVSGLAGAVVLGGGFYLFVTTLWLSIFVVAATLAAGLLAFGVYAGLICQGVLEGRWTLRRLREEIALLRRPPRRSRRRRRGVRVAHFTREPELSLGSHGRRRDGGQDRRAAAAPAHGGRRISLSPFRLGPLPSAGRSASILATTTRTGARHGCSGS